jgi:hypothetical protein
MLACFMEIVVPVRPTIVLAGQPEVWAHANLRADGVSYVVIYALIEESTRNCNFGFRTYIVFRGGFPCVLVAYLRVPWGHADHRGASRYKHPVPEGAGSAAAA